MLREAARVLSHDADDEKNFGRMRNLSVEISDSVPAFMLMRTKLHGNPEASDYERVLDFLEDNKSSLSEDIQNKLKALSESIKNAFAKTTLKGLEKYTAVIPEKSPALKRLKNLLQSGSVSEQTLCVETADLIYLVREETLKNYSSESILSFLDLSIDLEMLFFRSVGNWKSSSIKDTLLKCYTLALSAAGCGFIEMHEWEMIKPHLEYIPDDNRLKLGELNKQFDIYHRILEWSTGMVRAFYIETVNTFFSFEPLSLYFIDARIRLSILLKYGDIIKIISDYRAGILGIENDIMGLGGANRARGLNPGYAAGKLNVSNKNFAQADYKKDEIYVMLKPPPDLKPVAGIASVSGGNIVSHVQLLARNLGIPNAVVTPDIVEDLQVHAGKTVFYAVSGKGTVIMKPEEKMNKLERDLITSGTQHAGKIAIPTDKIDLNTKRLIPLHKLRARHSGIFCGPKAANLGQLSAIFPGNVAPGFIIPFGVFFSHMQQRMPGTNGSYWQFLKDTFPEVMSARTSDSSEEGTILARLNRMRDAIRQMPLSPPLTQALTDGFTSVFNESIGTVPVFIRSDTNVEDLKNFTGAGLNLTVPNLIKENDILQAVRDVWASPFTERSYLWRQRFLENPLHVYPSILILRSIPSDKSGVIITTGLYSHRRENISISFNRGVGGAVEGQSAEEYESTPEGSLLLISPSREPAYKRLSKYGGIYIARAGFSRPILDDGNMEQILRLCRYVRKLLPEIPGIESGGPYDIELGFENGRMWLFQVRPFVESRQARSSDYLRSLDPEYSEDEWVSLGDDIKPGGCWPF